MQSPSENKSICNAKPRPFADTACLAVAQFWPCGLSPFAPGTMGSLGAILLAPFLFLPLSLPLRALVLALLFLVGTYVSTRAEQILGKTDPGSVVIDEVVGQWIAIFLFLPTTIFTAPAIFSTYVALLVPFALFRFFDILKPWPVCWAQNTFPKGLGVMLDDVLAGLYALLLLILGTKIIDIVYQSYIH